MILWFATPAWAHRPGLSTARIDDGLHLSLSNAEWAVLDGAAPVQLAVDGQPCTLDAPVVTPAGDGVDLFVGLHCPAGTSWTYQAGFLGDLAPGHRHYVEADGQALGVLDAGSDLVAFEGEATSTLEVAAEFVHLGVEHILIGYDHLAFLLVLLLVGKTARQLLGILTGFTVAHSVTLSLAALGLVTPPGWIVEAAIAASIAWAGLENLTNPSPRRRFALTFGLGLIHGFGFAGVLRELGLPAGNLATALVSFNVGVELGQVALFALVFPVLLFASRWERWGRVAVPAISIAIALLGGYWTVERLFG